MFDATIITDAAHCSDMKLGAYGYCVSYSNKRLTGGDYFKVPVDNSNNAEMMAICNALCIAFNKGAIKEGSFVLIQTDSLASIAAFERRRNLRNEQEQGVFIFYEKFVRERTIRVEFRHVKGHSGVKDQRSLANKMCDKRAYDMLQKARREKKAEVHINKIREVLNNGIETQRT